MKRSLKTWCFAGRRSEITSPLRDFWFSDGAFEKDVTSGARMLRRGKSRTRNGHRRGTSQAVSPWWCQVESSTTRNCPSVLGGGFQHKLPAHKDVGSPRDLGPFTEVAAEDQHYSISLRPPSLEARCPTPQQGKRAAELKVQPSLAAVGDVLLQTVSLEEPHSKD